MFNYEAIDKTPTIAQIKAIVEYVEANLNINSGLMMNMLRPAPNIIHIDINNAHTGIGYKVTFNGNRIELFEEVSQWIS